MVNISQIKEVYNNIDLEKSYNALFELLWYSQMPCYDVRDVTSNKNNEFGESDFLVHIFKWNGIDLYKSSAKLFNSP
jgi:hypothetical protein